MFHLRGEKFQHSLKHPLIFFRCRMFLSILKLPLNCTECVSLHGWFRETWLSSAPMCSLRPILLLLRYPLTNKQRVLVQKCPWWQIIHYSWINEINALCLSFFNHNDSARDRKSPIPFRSLYTNSTIEYHDFSISPGPPSSTSPGPDFPSGKDLNILGMCFLFKLQVKIQFTSTH